MADALSRSSPIVAVIRLGKFLVAEIAAVLSSSEPPTAMIRVMPAAVARSTWLAME